MSERDTLLRQLALLQLIPRYPGRIASTALQDKLRQRGFTVSLRSIQRDLERLSGCFPLMRDDSERQRYRWSIAPDASLDLSIIDTPTALALGLAERHLTALLPRSVLDYLQPQFARARQHLDELGQNDLAHWARRVRAMPDRKTLIPAPIQPEVWRTVSDALLERKQLKVRYLSRSKSEERCFLLHPVAYLSRHAVSYLIASVEGFEDLRQFALHRIQQAECLDAPAREPESFDFDHYLQGSGFNNTGPVETVELVADVAPGIAWLLQETPLSTKQTLTPLPKSDWHQLKARVPDDQETRWWVFSLGETIVVHEPTEWRAEIGLRAKKMLMNYCDGSGAVPICSEDFISSAIKKKD